MSFRGCTTFLSGVFSIWFAELYQACFRWVIQGLGYVVSKFVCSYMTVFLNAFLRGHSHSSSSSSSSSSSRKQEKERKNACLWKVPSMRDLLVLGVLGGPGYFSLSLGTDAWHRTHFSGSQGAVTVAPGLWQPKQGPEGACHDLLVIYDCLRLEPGDKMLLQDLQATSCAHHYYHCHHHHHRYCCCRPRRSTSRS